MRAFIKEDKWKEFKELTNKYGFYIDTKKPSKYYAKPIDEDIILLVDKKTRELHLITPMGKVHLWKSTHNSIKIYLMKVIQNLSKEGLIDVTREEQEREKELKRLIYIRNEIIKVAKKELRQYRDELNSLGNNKERRDGDGKGKRLVRKK